jgi:hypothetical protein
MPAGQRKKNFSFTPNFEWQKLQKAPPQFATRGYQLAISGKLQD